MGLVAPDRFLFGEGMDYKGYGRNLRPVGCRLGRHDHRFDRGDGLRNLDAMMVENSLTLSTSWGAPSRPLLRGSLGGAPVLYLARHGKGHALLLTQSTTART